MTPPEYEVVVTLVEGDSRERRRMFKSGAAVAPFSVGVQGDWLVSAQGVASVQLWLRFDGVRLYAAGAGTEATAYLQGIPIDNTWHEVPDRSELRLGRARLTVFCRPVDASSSIPGPPPAQGPLDARRLTPIERAAAVPLPSFFTDRLREKRSSSPAAPRLQRAPLRTPERPHPRSPAPRDGTPLPAPRVSRARRGGLPWAVLAIPAVLVPLSVGSFWLIRATRHAEEPAAAPALSATILPPPAAVAAPDSTSPAEPPFGERSLAPLPALPVLEVPPAGLPTVAENLAPPKSASSAPLKVFPQNVADRSVPRTGAEPSVISEEWLAHHERQLQAPNRGRAKVIFLGDSITEGWGVVPAYREKFGKYAPLNLGIVSDTTQNVLWRIEHGALTGTNPKVVVLMIGVNNLAGGFSAQQTVAGIKAIIAAVRARLPDAQVLLLGILPARQSPDDPLRQRIVEANRLLAALPMPSGVTLHDVGAVLLEPDGTLSKETLRDFVHPTAAGFERLSEAVAPLVDALMGASASENAASQNVPTKPSE